MSETSTKVLIVGGGMAGLSAAYELSQQRVPWVLVEAAPRLGGIVRTERSDDYLFDAGPDSFIVTKPWALALCDELGLRDSVITVPEQHRQTFILHEGKLQRLPEGTLLGIPTRFGPFAKSKLFSWPGKARMVRDYLLSPVDWFLQPPPESAGADESIQSFVTRTLGREAHDRLLGPLLAGIHAGDPATLSIRSTFPQLARLEDEYGNLVSGALALRRERGSHNGPAPSPFRSLAGGMQQLVDTLTARLPAERLRVSTPVQQLSLSPPPHGGWTAELPDGHTLRAKIVLLAVPGHAAAGLLRNVDPFLADRLREIRYVSTATLHLGWPASAFSRALVGTGFLVPKTERRRILACTFSSNKFPHRAASDRVLVRVFFGGARDEAMAGRDEADLIRIAREELEDLIGVRAPPDVVRLYRYPKSNPQYEVGHAQRVAVIRAREADLLGLHLVGSPYEGVGLPDAVRQGRQAAARVAGNPPP